MSRKSKRVGDFAEAAVLADQQARCQQRGWGFAVPLSPIFPADVLVVTPLGPTFIEVKATMHPTRSVHTLSAPEARMAAECGAYGALYIMATVRVGKVRGPVPGAMAVTSLSYSPVPAIGPRRGPRALRKAPHYLRSQADGLAIPFWNQGTTYRNEPAPRASLPRDGWTTYRDTTLESSAVCHSGGTSPTVYSSVEATPSRVTPASDRKEAVDSSHKD
jgi:hypothetical protein